MKNPWSGILLLLIIALFVISLIWAITLLPNMNPHADRSVMADIYLDGKKLYSIDLSSVTENTTLELTGESGITNIIAIAPGRIGMLKADCPDKLCVKQGYCSAPCLPITCLPGKVVIQLRYDTAKYNIDFPTTNDDSANIITPDIITY
ncbi:MAG: NusG domain II-containing protein [Lachnospiraceae bacterium]|nr:NusG domain II-containing protein [Lachnospiraceae bacterium]